MSRLEFADGLGATDEMTITEQLRIVLVETSHPGNIGAAARAMKTMGLSRLCLVRPREFPSAEATARASGADDVLVAAQVCDSLEQALAGCCLVVGSSARLRSVRWPQLDARACGRLLAGHALHEPVALVFGREHSGLSNDELDQCHYLAHIPASPAYQSLNLAAAVQVFCYEIMMARNDAGHAVAGTGGEEPAASSEAMEAYYRHLEETLLEIGFFKPPNYRKLMRRLRRLYNRARPTMTELDMLRGILSAAQGRKYRWLKDAGLASGAAATIKKDSPE